MSISSFKKVSAAAVAVVLGFTAASHAATVPYSTGFEASEGYTTTPSNLVGQNSWTNLAGETATGATVVAPGLSGSGQAVKIVASGLGGAPGNSAVYSDYYNSSLSPTLTPGSALTTTVSIDTALGTNGAAPDLAGVEVLNTLGNPVASFFTSTGPDGLPDLVISDGAGNLKDVPGFATAADGVTGTYSITLDPTASTFTVSYGGQTTSGVLSALGIYSDAGPLSIALATVDQGGTGSSATFDNLSVTSAVPEPASIAMVGLGGLMLIGKRRKRTA